MIEEDEENIVVKMPQREDDGKKKVKKDSQKREVKIIKTGTGIDELAKNSNNFLMSVASMNDQVKVKEPEPLDPIPLKKIYDNSKPKPAPKATHEESDQVVLGTNFVYGTQPK